MLQDHEFFLHCDPHMTKFELVDPAEPKPAHLEEEKIRALGPADGSTTAYRVNDLVHTLPAGLWDSNVVSTYEFTNIRNGVFVRIRSPLSVVMDTVWEIRSGGGGGEGGDGGGWELVEDVFIACSRLLVGTVRAQCEGGWKQIHAKMMDRLREDMQTK